MSSPNTPMPATAARQQQHRSTTTITMNTVINKTASYFKTSPSLLIDRRRDSAVLIPRQIAVYIILELINASVTEIAGYFHKSRSAILHSRRRISDALNKDLVIKNAVDAIISDLKENF